MNIGGRLRSVERTGVARGYTGCTCIPPQGGEKKLGRDLQEKLVSESKAEQKVKCLRTFLLGGGDLEGRSG